MVTAAQVSATGDAPAACDDRRRAAAELAWEAEGRLNLAIC
jgi:hypothetical protein